MELILAETLVMMCRRPVHKMEKELSRLSGLCCHKVIVTVVALVCHGDEGAEPNCKALDLQVCLVFQLSHEAGIMIERMK